jgi:hypothetical protein
MPFIEMISLYRQKQIRLFVSSCFGIGFFVKIFKL